MAFTKDDTISPNVVSFGFVAPPTFTFPVAGSGRALVLKDD